MKKLLLSIGSFALSLSALNAAQLDLPENAAEIASDPNCIPLLAEAVLSPLPGEGDVDPFTTATAAESVAVAGCSVSPGGAQVFEILPFILRVVKNMDVGALAKAVEAANKLCDFLESSGQVGALAAAVEVANELCDLLKNGAQVGASARGNNRSEEADQVRLKFTIMLVKIVFPNVGAAH